MIKKKKNMSRAVAAIVLAGTLTACGSVNTRTIVSKPGFSDFFTYAAANRDFKFSVMGDPFHGQKAQLTAATIAQFQRNYAQYNTHFTTTPNDTALPPYHIVVAYGNVVFGTEDEICKGDGAYLAPSAPGQLEILAVYCDDNAMTFNRAAIPMPSGPNDPALARTLNDMAYRLIPEEQDTVPTIMYGAGQ